MPAFKRPVEITLLAWLVIAIAIVRLLAWLAVSLIPSAQENLLILTGAATDKAIISFPTWSLVGFSLISAVLSVVAAGAILMTKNWGRIVLLSWAAIALVFSYVTVGSFAYLLPKLCVYAVFLVILLSPRATRFFRQ